MTVTAHWYGLALGHIANKEIDLDSDTFKCALVTSSYTPDMDADEFWSTPQADEASGTNYSAGGTTLTTVSLVYDPATNRMQWEADDAVWANATVTARYAVVYDSTPGTAGTDFLICYTNFGVDMVATAHEFRVAWASGVVAYIEAA